MTRSRVWVWLIAAVLAIGGCTDAHQQDTADILALVHDEPGLQDYRVDERTITYSADGTTATVHDLIGGVSGKTPGEVAAHKTGTSWELGCIDIDGTFVSFGEKTKAAQDVRLYLQIHHICPNPYRIGDPVPVVPGT